MSDGGKPPRIGRNSSSSIPPYRPTSTSASSQPRGPRAEKSSVKVGRNEKTGNPDCLLTTIGRTQSVIELEESQRSQETGSVTGWRISSWRRPGRTLRSSTRGSGLNDDLPAGTELLLRHVIEIFRYDDVIAVRSFPAESVMRSSTDLRVPAQAPGRTLRVRVGVRKSSEQRNEVWRLLQNPDVSCEQHGHKVAAVPFLLCGGDEYPLKANNLGTDKSSESIRDNPFNDPPDRKRRAGDSATLPRRKSRRRQDHGDRAESRRPRLSAEARDSSRNSAR